MKINKSNVNQICSIKSIINKTYKWYVYKKAKKFFGMLYQKEGFYWTYSISGDIWQSIEEILTDKRLLCIDNKIYFKPHLEIKMSNGDVVAKYFETENDLMEFMESDIMKDVNWINI